MLNAAKFGLVVMHRSWQVTSKVLIPYKRRWNDTTRDPGFRCSVNGEPASLFVAIIDPTCHVAERNARVTGRQVVGNRLPTGRVDFGIAPGSAVHILCTPRIVHPKDKG